MRFMSFALTTEQVRRREKTVTRRLGWLTAKPGDVVQPAVKCQGLKKGETVERIGGPIRFRTVRREHLTMLTDLPTYGRLEMLREGFPTMTADEFVAMFCRHNDVTRVAVVTRIEFEYLDDEGAR